MKWLSDMFLFWVEWLLILIIPLLLGLLIGWGLWYRRWKDGEQKQEEQKARILDLEEKLVACKEKNAEVEKELQQEETSIKDKDKRKYEDDLSLIEGIDEELESNLKDYGIKTFYQLALLNDADVEALESELDCEFDQIRNGNWVPQAAQLHFEEHGEEIYDRVTVEGVYADEFEKQLAESKQGKIIDYKDDLTLIKGVGPKMEKMLHDFGVQTLFQLSQFNDEGVEALNKKLEFFPGRIQRDDWIGQAKFLHEQIHGDEV